MPVGGLLQFALAVVITAIGIACLAGHVLRPTPKDRLLLWTGLFAALYGVRMFVKEPLVRLLNLPSHPAAYAESILNYFILIPGLLFTGELYGRGWRNSLRILTGVTAAYAVAGVVIDGIARDPGRLPDPTAVVLAPGVLVVFGVGALAGYRPPRFPEWRVLLGGVAVFVAFVFHEHAASLLGTPRNLEPIGYLVSVLCLGYIAVTRFFANARQLAATDRELQAAREIQASILPRELPAVAGVDVAVRYEPLAAVAGDFYDFVSLPGGALAVLVADVSGHGVPAALIASMVKVAFAAETARASDPAAILAGMNTTLCGMFDRAYVTAVCARVAPASQALVYAIAGHPPPLLVSPDGTVRVLDDRGMFLGMFPSAAYTSASEPIGDGARLLLYTDGVTEAPDPATDDLFGVTRLIEFARAGRDRSAHDFANALLAEVAAFARRDPLPHDDVTVLVVDVTRAAGS